MVLFCCLAAAHAQDKKKPALKETDAAVMKELAQSWLPEGWVKGEDPCDWPGVVCTTVTESGVLSKSVATVVKSISLRGVCEHAAAIQTKDHWTCDLPSSLGKLSGLEFLYLNGNGFQGTIPSQLGNIKTLKALYLNSNELWGSIPDSLGKLSALEKLHLQGNKLTGDIPASFGSLAALHELQLQNNELQGSIPAELGQLKSLVQLDLSSNDLEGRIPPSLSALADLHALLLQDNMLQGGIPEDLFGASMRQLSRVDLSSNLLTGHVPLGVCRLDHLALFSVEGNSEMEGERLLCDSRHGRHADEENRAHCQQQMRSVLLCGRLHGASAAEL